MKRYILTLLLATSILIGSEFQDFLNRVNNIPDPADKQAAVDSFLVYAESVGVPFVEETTANFIYNGNVSTVKVAGEFNGWNTTSLSKLSGTSFWYLSRTFEIDARFDYKLVIDGNYILDPLNPNTVPGGFGKNSELAMPGYVQPWEIVYDPNVERGKLTNFKFQSEIMNREYTVYVYMPADYDSTNISGYPAVYYQDGSDYMSLGYGWIILDNLIANNLIESVIGVFVRPTNRNDEYAYDNRFNYSQFFAEELVPHIDTTFNTIHSPEKRLVLGDSFGGNISALISYQYPEVFALCGLHSAAFWPNDYEVYHMIVNGDKKNIKYYSVWGSYEGSLTANMNTFLTEMNSLGYEIEGKQFNEGHSWGLWRATTDLILEYFFPSNATSVDEEMVANDFVLYQNYPNPFNPTTTIKFSVPESKTFSNVKLVVYNSLGEVVSIIVNESLSAGNYEVNFNAQKLSSGVYFYTLNVEGMVQTKKMILIK